jgi:hypothetical protein
MVEVFELLAERPLGIAPDTVKDLANVGRLRLLHERLTSVGLVPPRSTMDLLRTPFRVFASCLRTTYRPSGIYGGPVRLILLNDVRLDEGANRRYHAATIAGWRKWAPHLHFALGAGNHLTAFKTPHVSTLASLVSEQLAP